MKKLIFVAALFVVPSLWSQGSVCSHACQEDYPNGKGCLACSSGTDKLYCTCSVRGSCPQVAIDCGNCSPINGNSSDCDDCCPGCKCKATLGASAPKLGLWSKDETISERVSAASSSTAKAIKGLQEGPTLACRSKRIVVAVLQDDHKTVSHFTMTLTSLGSVILEGDGEKFVADDKSWQVLKNNTTVLSGDVTLQ